MRRRGRFAELHAEIENARLAAAPPILSVAESRPKKARYIAVVKDWVIDKTCPKCGRDLPKRGAHFHLRACKG